MGKLYKLTDKEYKTKNNTLWGEGIEHEIQDKHVGELCSAHWLHAYEDSILAVMMNPGHANIKDPVMWEAEGEVGVSDRTKVGCKKLKTIKKIELPVVGTVQRIAFGILCAKEVCKKEKWVLWADKWLSGEDRTCKSAYAASSAAYADYANADYANADYAANAADAAAANAADAAAANAAYAASARKNMSINFIELAHKALTYSQG